MGENKIIENNDLEKVAGGIDTVFVGDVAICPVCGNRPIKIVSGDEYVDVYKCDHCGSQSIHTKKERPAEPKPHPNLVCPQCGTVGNWRIIKTENGLDSIECRVCRLICTTPAE